MRLLVSLLSLTMGCEAYLALPPSVYVCRTFPFCKMDLKTRAWSSSLTDGQGETTGMFEALEMPDSIRKIASQQGNFSREGKADDSACWINSAYCAPDYSVPPLTGIDVDSAAKCRAACKKDEDCNYFTFHNYHGQAKCYKLSACSLTVAKHCPSSGICASGSAECGCPALEANPTDSTSTTAYATWSCDSGVDPYSQTIPAGTNCKTDCKGWTGQVSVSLASTCQPMGDWSDTQTGYGKRSARNGRSFNLNKPDSGPIKCACRDLGPYNYNPNTRSGEAGITRFQCDGWSPEKYTAPFTIDTNDRCNLFCDKALVKTILCEANTWSGEPEKGFWCMSPPEQVAPAGIGGEQDGRSIKLHSDSTFDYYKVEVEAGVTMVEGATSTACEKLAMRAVCEGPSGCSVNDESKCQVTPLSTPCGNIMRGISEAICDGETNPRTCAELEGVFQYRKGSAGSDRGAVGGIMVQGKDHTSGDGDKTFAFCAKAKTT